MEDLTLKDLQDLVNDQTQFIKDLMYLLGIGIIPNKTGMDFVLKMPAKDSKEYVGILTQMVKDIDELKSKKSPIITNV